MDQSGPGHGGFAGAALALAVVGIFGMLSYTVNTRRREIGVRRGMGYALLGAGLGLAAAVVGTRPLASALFNVSPTDLPTLTAVTLLLLVVALVACWLPARRAAAIDPADAIRPE